MNAKNIPLGLILVFLAIVIITFFVQTTRGALAHSGQERAKNLSVKIYLAEETEVAGNKIIVTGLAGSGIVFSRNGYVLTAAHVVKKNATQEIYIGINDGSIFQGKILAIDTENDLAAIRVKTIFFSEIRLGDNQFEPWEKVYSHNCLHGACGTYTEGNFINHGKNMSALDGVENMILFDMFIAGGASGSGIFDTNHNLISLTLGGIALTEPAETNKVILSPDFPTATYGPNIKTIHHFLAVNHLPHRHHSLF